MAEQYRLYSFAQLSTSLLYDILALRSKIFVVEQNIAYLDADGNDQHCLHLCLMEGDRLIGYARIVPPGLKFPEAAIGRIVVDVTCRGKGMGKALMQRAMEETYNAYGDDVPIIVEAQAHLQPFYTSIGYVTYTEPYMLEGLMHVRMRYEESPPVSRKASS